MKKRKVQPVNKSEDVQFDMEVKTETLSRLMLNENYVKEDVAKVAEYLMKIHNYDFKQQFTIVDDIEVFQNFLHGVKDIVIRGLPVFIIYNVHEIHWITICIISLQNDIIILCKDPCGEKSLGSELKNAVIQIFAVDKVICKFHTATEQTDDVNCGPISLKNLEIMLTESKLNKLDFINNFEKTKFCCQTEVQNVKKQFKTNLQKHVAQGIMADIWDIAKDEEFKNAVSEFIDTCSKYTVIDKQFKQYNTFIENEISKQEKDPNYDINIDNIKTIKQQIFDNPVIQLLKKQINLESINQPSEDKPKIDNKNCTYLLEIEKKFPVQMKKFTKIFAFLNKTTGDQNREEILKDISTKLNIDYNKIKTFFEMRINSQNKEEEEKILSKNINTINEELSLLKEERKEPDTEGIKTLEQLLAETLLITNVEDCEKSERKPLNLQIGNSKEYYRKFYEKNNEILNIEKNYHRVKEVYLQWQYKTAQDIYDWAMTTKGQLNSNNLCNALGIMDRANELVTGGHRLRDSQIISALILLQLKSNYGRLSQILTGEGKTVIVSLLAALKVLQGETVDVITSNQVLAKCAVDDRENFYGLLAISVANNNLDESYKRGPKECYSADIVYGSIANFQFDHLRDIFEGMKTRNKRQFGYVILDEVDSMLIDNGGYIAKLAGPFPGIDFLRYVYIKIWQELHKAVQSLCTDFEKNIEKKRSELADKETNIPEKSKVVLQEYNDYILELFSNQLTELKNKIKSSDPANIDLIPAHLKQYSKDMLDTWIDNAIYAKYLCKENEQYVIKEKNGEDVIVPVDYENTGVTLRNTIWSNGLHQFIQLKHNLRLTSESLTSSFISNIGYIKLYNNKLYGLTGTLGSVAEQKLLSKAYNLDYVKIPTYKQKKFKELDGIVAKDEQWNNCVTLTSLILALENRSVLIICKTISDLRRLERNIEAAKKLEKCTDIKIKTYPDEDNSKIVDVEIGIREIIIATNIAGRGTDFKTSLELEKNGGLHVCVSFLPVNQRVEDQAFGRTARQGNSGTAQLIIKRSDIFELGMDTVPTKFATIRKRRDQCEILRLKNVENKELTEIDFQDNLFNKFSILYREFKGESNNRNYLANDLREHWAFWLKKSLNNLRDKNFSQVDVDKEFINFMEDANTKQILGYKQNGKFIGGKISHNPYYCIREAEYFLDNNKINQAEDSLNRAIKISGKNDLLYPAYIKLFEVEIEKGCQLRERFKKAMKQVLFIDLFTDVTKDEKYKSRAIDALKRAKKALEKEIAYIRNNFFNDDSVETKIQTQETRIGSLFSNIRDYFWHDSDTPVIKDVSSAIDNQDLVNILMSENSSFIKNMQSRLLILESFKHHAESLLQQIEENPDKGIAINGRIPDYLKQLDTKNESEKQLKMHLYGGASCSTCIGDAALSELGFIGLETMYSLIEVHDVPQEVRDAAVGQISAGIAAIGVAVAFPPSALVMGRIASTLITEGIGDLVMELISNGKMEFNKNLFIKSKCISYGISLVTMGLEAIITCTNILNRAINMCKSLSTFLRRTLNPLCMGIADYVDKLANYLQKLRYAVQISKLNKAVELSRMQILRTTLRKVGEDTLKSVVGSIVSEKIVTKGLDNMLQNYKPIIRKCVEETVKEKIREEHVKVIKQKDMCMLINEIFIGTYGEMATEVLKEISLGILRHNQNLKIKIASVVVDTGVSVTSAITYTKEFCKKLKKLLKEMEDKMNHEIVNDIKEKIEIIITLVTDKIYSIILQLTNKYANTFVVAPIMNKMWGKMLDETQNSSVTDTTDDRQELHDIVDAYEELGIEPGAPLHEINTAYKNVVHQNQPVESSENNSSSKCKEKIQKATEAHQYLVELHVKGDNTKYVFVKPIDDISTDIKESRKAHKGNIESLSQEEELYIIINKHKPNGEVTKFEFGKEFENDNNHAIILDYYPPNHEYEGHFKNSKGVEHVEITSTGIDNCFYDGVASQLKARGRNTTSEQLRQQAEKRNPNNIYHDILQESSEQLKNPITADLYKKIRSELLIGGNIRYYFDDNTSSDAEDKLIASQGKPSESQVLEKARDGKPATAHPMSHVTRLSPLESIPEHDDISFSKNTSKHERSTKTEQRNQTTQKTSTDTETPNPSFSKDTQFEKSTKIEQKDSTSPLVELETDITNSSSEKTQNILYAEDITKLYPKNSKSALPLKKLGSITNEIMHMECYKEAVDRLNSDALEVTLTIPADRLVKNKNTQHMQIAKGKFKKWEQSKSFVVILGHHAGTLDHTDADPNIKTIYANKNEVDDISIKVTHYREQASKKNE